MALPKEIENLSFILGRLPGVGPKLSMRLALYLAVRDQSLSHNIISSINEMQEKVMQCKECGNLSNTPICDICSSETRDRSKILIIEDPIDLNNIEESGIFNGLYHILGGLISPINGVGPEELSIKKLLERIKELKISEVIFALNPSLEGDATSLYIKDEIEKQNTEITITRLAKGIPHGGDIEFVSNQTIIDSLKSRTSF